MLSLASQINSQPLPSVPEVFGVRLPPASDCLTGVDFDLLPNKPPPTITQYDEEIEEIEESPSEDEDEDMEPAVIPPATQDTVILPPVNASNTVHTPSDVDMMGVEDVVGTQPDDGSEEEDDGLFAGGDDDDDGMEEVTPVVDAAAANGVKRKLVEEDDYD